MEYTIMVSNKKGEFLNINNYKFAFKFYGKNSRTFKCISCKCYPILDNDRHCRHTQKGTPQDSFPIHQHPNHEAILNKAELRNQCKSKIQSDLGRKVKRAYDSTLRESSKTVGVPSFCKIKCSLFCKNIFQRQFSTEFQPRSSSPF